MFRIRICTFFAIKNTQIMIYYFSCGKKNNIKKITILFALCSLIIISGCESKKKGYTPSLSSQHWDYENPDWEGIGYSDCGGKVESPISIDTLKTVKAHLPDLNFNYNSFQFKIVDTGHTIQVVNPGNNKVIIGDTEFNLKQFHFHHGSEHAINGIKADMELHLVHEDMNNNLLVLAVMLKKGLANTAIQKIWNHIPSLKEREEIISDQVDLNDLLPPNRKYYTYTGSLTTPPCTVGVDWVLFEDPVAISEAQIKKFTQVYENNTRPLQLLNNRFVLQDAD